MKPIFTIPLRNGVIAGILGAALLIGLYYMGRHPFLIEIFLDFRIFLFGVFIFFGLKELRDHHGDGLLSFGEGMMSSFVFVTTYGIVASLIIGVFGEAEKDFVTSFIRLLTEQVKNLNPEDVSRIGKENIDRNLETLSTTNSYRMAWNYFKQCYWLGLFISVILSVVLRRQPKP